jgi:hypothetical protein
MKTSIYSKRVLQALVLVSALSLSSLVLADADADNGGVAANENSSVLGISDSDLSTTTDASTNIADSENGNDLSTNTDASMNATDSGNTDNSTNIADSENGNDLSTNTDNSNYQTIGNIYETVALSELSSSVTGNSFSAGGAPVYTGANMVDNGSLSNSAGITQVSMNSGFEALTQQSVNVQANLSLGQ